MKIKEIAEKLKVSKTTVLRWINLGFIKAGKTKNIRGGHPVWDITQKDLDIYLKKLN
jgi:excisionase family DNA binding protein